MERIGCGPRAQEKEILSGATANRSDTDARVILLFIYGTIVIFDGEVAERSLGATESRSTDSHSIYTISGDKSR